MTRYPSQFETGNHLLQQLAVGDREELLTGARPVTLPAGQTIAKVDDPSSTVYFPDAGVIALVREMTTGHHLAVTAVGAEGVVGLDALFGLPHRKLSLVVLVESTGHYVDSGHFLDLFQRSRTFRSITLAHVGTRLLDAMIAAACNRVHSHRQRLARWLLAITDKAGRRALSVTHGTLAQLVGGPRYAVTVALNHLRAKGAVAHSRGRIEILNRPVLVAQACECYGALTSTALYRQHS